METPYIWTSTCLPQEGKKIDDCNKQSKYIVKVVSPTDLAEALFEYAENFRCGK